MADVTTYGYTSPEGAPAAVWLGNASAYFGIQAQVVPQYFFGRPRLDYPVPALVSASSKDDRMSLVFTDPVDPGSPSFPAKASAKDPTLTGVSAVSTTALDLLWTLIAPKLVTATSYDAAIQLAFDIPVDANVGVVTFPAKESAKDPTLTATAQAGANTINVDWTLSVPQVLSAYSADAGLFVIFDTPVDVGAPVFPPRESAVDPTVTAMTQVLPAEIEFNWTPGGAAQPVVTPPVTAAAFQVDIVFDQVIYLTGSGVLTTAWTITPYPGAASVSVLSVTKVAPDTIRLATSMMTAGTANYRLTIAVASVANGGGGTNALTAIDFDGVDAAFTIASATVLNPDLVDIEYSEVPGYTSALNPLNYSIDNGLQVLSVIPALPKGVRITTSNQTPGTIYNLTISNVVDTAGNPLV